MPVKQKKTSRQKVRSTQKKRKKVSAKSFVWKLLKRAGIVVLALAGLSILTVIVYRFINPPVTPLTIIRSFEGVTPLSKREWIPFDQIPQNMIEAVVASEDNKFVKHHGFDFGEMREAYKQSQNGNRLRGASTITQQMCKNVFLWDGRSYIRKGLEAWFTVWVELIWNKQRIMEVYLNVIEMGNGIYGIEAASQVYYHKPASKLSREEAAMITVALPSPGKRNPAQPTEYMRKRQKQILDLMKKNGQVKL